MPKKLKTYVHFCWLRIHRNYKIFCNLAMCKRQKLNRKSRISFGIKNYFRCITSKLYWTKKNTFSGVCKRQKLNRKSRISFGIKNYFRCITSKLYWTRKESIRPGQLRKGSYYWRKSMRSHCTNSVPVLCTVVRVLALQTRNLTSLPNSLNLVN